MTVPTTHIYKLLKHIFNSNYVQQHFFSLAVTGPTLSSSLEVFLMHRNDSTKAKAVYCFTTVHIAWVKDTCRPQSFSSPYIVVLQFTSFHCTMWRASKLIEFNTDCDQGFIRPILQCDLQWTCKIVIITQPINKQAHCNGLNTNWMYTWMMLQKLVWYCNNMPVIHLQS